MYVDRKVEIRHHLTDQGELLEVLFAEDGVLALRDLEEFVHHGEDTRKVRGASSALKAKRCGTWCDGGAWT